MDEYERPKGGVAVEIHDQEQMHMIRHDDRIGGCERRIERVQMPPERSYAFPQRCEARPTFLINDAREHLSPSRNAQGDEEELQSMTGKSEVHQAKTFLIKICMG